MVLSPVPTTPPSMAPADAPAGCLGWQWKILFYVGDCKFPDLVHKGRVGQNRPMHWYHVQMIAHGITHFKCWNQTLGSQTWFPWVLPSKRGRKRGFKGPPFNQEWDPLRTQGYYPRVPGGTHFWQAPVGFTAWSCTAPAMFDRGRWFQTHTHHLLHSTVT